MAHPTGQGRGDPRLQIRPDIDKGWRSGSAVKEIYTRSRQRNRHRNHKVDRECASGMGEIPDHDGAARLCLFGEQRMSCRRPVR